jgi:hypothetical protein
MFPTAQKIHWVFTLRNNRLMLCTEQMVNQSDISRNAYTRCAGEMSSFVAGGPCKLSYAWKWQIGCKLNRTLLRLGSLLRGTLPLVAWSGTRRLQHAHRWRHTKQHNASLGHQRQVSLTGILFLKKRAFSTQDGPPYYRTEPAAVLSACFARPSDVTLRRWQLQRFTLLKNAPTSNFSLTYRTAHSRVFRGQ